MAPKTDVIAELRQQVKEQQNEIASLRQQLASLACAPSHICKVAYLEQQLAEFEKRVSVLCGIVMGEYPECDERYKFAESCLMKEEK